jgi:hypothetical protein
MIEPFVLVVSAAAPVGLVGAVGGDGPRGDLGGGGEQRETVVGVVVPGVPSASTRKRNAAMSRL